MKILMFLTIVNYLKKMIDFTNIIKVNNDREFGFHKKPNENIIFYVPEQLKISDNIDNPFDYFKVLKLYIEVLLKYSNSKSKDINYNNEDADYNLSVLEGLLNILEDYFHNDEFYLFEHFYSNNNNKINWSKTIRNNDIIISNENVFYKDFFSKNKKKDDHSQFYKLYKNALNISFQIFLGLDTEDISFEFSENEALYYISKYEDEHFKDRELFISKNLKKIYIDNMFSNHNSKVFESKYHTKFENIWENIIENLIPLKYQYNGFKSGTIGFYNIKRNNKLFKKDGLRFILDHIFEKNNKINILDSKFYHSENNIFPSSKDIGKQILYKNYIHKIENNQKEVFNHFIFPKKDKNNVFSFIGKHEVEGFEEYTINCWELDIDYALNMFVNDYKSNLIIEEINNKAFN